MTPWIRRIGAAAIAGLAAGSVVSACRIKTARSPTLEGDYPCTTVEECPLPDTPCLVAMCDVGQCIHTYAPAGPLPPEEQKRGDCLALYCDGFGQAVTRPAPVDGPPDDDNPCTVEACDAGKPVTRSKAVGAPCPQGVCNAQGGCGVCLPGVRRCEAGAVQSCSEAGSWDEPVACVDAPCRGERCVEVAELAVGRRHACVRLGDGSVHCWGDDGFGQLGRDGADSAEAPSFARGARSVGFGGEHACLLRGDGTVACWGANNHGELGSGNYDSSEDPVDVAGLAGVSALAVGGRHSCALAGGVVSCWGLGERGQLGSGKAPAEVQDLGLFNDYPSLGADKPSELPAVSGSGLLLVGNTTCVRGPSGLACWGVPTYYGVDPIEDAAEKKARDKIARNTPQAVQAVSGAVQVAAGAQHSCALAGGSVFCWGANDAGQLGDGSTVDRYAPQQVSGLSDVVRIGLGDRHGCALDAAGSVFCWGAGEAGELGDGQGSSSPTPVRVSGLDRVRELAVGADFACVRVESGAVRCWGANDAGQLGHGATDGALAPVPLAFP